MSYVVVRSCSSEVDIDGFGRWFRKACGDTSDAMAVIERLRTGKSYTLFLGEKETAQFMRMASRWGLTGVTRHDNDDLSAYLPPPGFWGGAWWRLCRWLDKA